MKVSNCFFVLLILCSGVAHARTFTEVYCVNNENRLSSFYMSYLQENAEAYLGSAYITFEDKGNSTSKSVRGGTSVTCRAYLSGGVSCYGVNGADEIVSASVSKESDSSVIGSVGSDRVGKSAVFKGADCTFTTTREKH